MPDRALNYADFIRIVGDIQFPEYELMVVRRGEDLVLYARYWDADIVTGKLTEQKTRKWLLSWHMVPSEVVQTAFKCIMTSMEHRVREHFLYKEQRVFGPHFDVEALVDIARARRLDYRGKGDGATQTDTVDDGRSSASDRVAGSGQVLGGDRSPPQSQADRVQGSDYAASDASGRGA